MANLCLIDGLGAGAGNGVDVSGVESGLGGLLEETGVTGVAADVKSPGAGVVAGVDGVCGVLLGVDAACLA
jgi:hypothetical protein